MSFFLPRLGLAVGFLTSSFVLASPCTAQQESPGGAQWTGEIGANDFRISDAGADSDASFDAAYQAVAYNPVDDEFLAVWLADDNVGGLIEGEGEIFGQLLDGAGQEIGTNDFRISDMGGTGEVTMHGLYPAVAFNTTTEQYLVVWFGDDNVGGLAEGELQIFGQLLDSSGGEVGSNDFVISDISEDNGNPGLTGKRVDVAFNSVDNEYLVVWEAIDDVGLTDPEREVFGQRLTSLGQPAGVNDFRISDIGEPGDSNALWPKYPKVAYNSVDNEYLVVWASFDFPGSLGSGEVEIQGQLLDHEGIEIGSNDFRISDMGGPDSAFAGIEPDVAFNPQSVEYLVVWAGDDNVGGVSADEFEIFGQLLDSNGGAVGADDFRISEMDGPLGDPRNHGARTPDVAYSDNGYLVVWMGTDVIDDDPADVQETEIYFQRLDAAGADLGGNERLSDSGGFHAANGAQTFEPAIAYGSNRGQHLVLWYSDDPDAALVDGEFEILGQRIVSPIFTDGFETADVTAWSASMPP